MRSGALPAKLTIVEERTVGPSLGSDSVRAGFIASVIGLIGVLIFMVISYGLFGVFAVIALVANLLMILGTLSFLGATLTLPGIAGIVLTMGMAVDSNVLVFERIREEVANGRSPLNAIGYPVRHGVRPGARVCSYAGHRHRGNGVYRVHRHTTHHFRLDQTAQTQGGAAMTSRELIRRLTP